MLLGAADALPGRPSRILVNGSSGSGKTTLAKTLAALWDLPHTELDGLFHGPGWMPRPTFDEDVAPWSGACAGPSCGTATWNPGSAPR